MHKAKHIASYCILFPIINPSFSYCNRVSPFFITHYILVIYKLLPIFQHLYYFIKPIFLHCSITARIPRTVVCMNIAKISNFWQC